MLPPWTDTASLAVAICAETPEIVHIRLNDIIKCLLYVFTRDHHPAITQPDERILEEYGVRSSNPAHVLFWGNISTGATIMGIITQLTAAIYDLSGPTPLIISSFMRIITAMSTSRTPISNVYLAEVCKLVCALHGRLPISARTCIAQCAAIRALCNVAVFVEEETYDTTNMRNAIMFITAAVFASLDSDSADGERLQDFWNTWIDPESPGHESFLASFEQLFLAYDTMLFRRTGHHTTIGDEFGSRFLGGIEVTALINLEPEILGSCSNVIRHAARMHQRPTTAQELHIRVLAISNMVESINVTGKDLFEYRRCMRRELLYAIHHPDEHICVLFNNEDDIDIFHQFINIPNTAPITAVRSIVDHARRCAHRTDRTTELLSRFIEVNMIMPFDEIDDEGNTALHILTSVPDASTPTAYGNAIGPVVAALNTMSLTTPGMSYTDPADPIGKLAELELKAAAKRSRKK